jgi:hypothetical protein
VPALLDGGEYVVQADAAQQYPDFLERYNVDPDRALARVRAERGEDGTLAQILSALTREDPHGRETVGVLRAILAELQRRPSAIQKRGSPVV